MAFHYSMARRYFVKPAILRSVTFIGLLSLLLSTGACQEPASPKPAPAQAFYFDVPGFIRSQARLLEKENPGAWKSVVENQHTRENKVLQDLKWNKELAVFSELDLNKPAFRNAYTVSRQADAAGLVTVSYRKKPGTEGDIAFLSVTTGPDQQVRELRAIRSNTNPLITSSQNLALSCANIKGRFRIQTFRIAGLQDPIFFDSLQYLIITEIR
jgi:hypothetical protein